MTSTFPRVVTFDRANDLMENIVEEEETPQVKYGYERTAYHCPSFAGSALSRLKEGKPVVVQGKRKWRSESCTFYNAQGDYMVELVMDEDKQDEWRCLDYLEMKEDEGSGQSQLLALDLRCEARRDTVIKWSSSSPKQAIPDPRSILKANQPNLVQASAILTPEREKAQDRPVEPPKKRTRMIQRHLCTFPNCRLEFSNQKTLLLHERCDHGIKVQLPCKFCPRFFLTEGERRYHMDREHSVHHDKLFKCSSCNKSFAYQKNFERHGLICGKSGPEADVIRSQFPTYKKFNRKLKCAKCGTLFAKEVNRDRHQLICMKERVFIILEDAKPKISRGRPRINAN